MSDRLITEAAAFPVDLDLAKAHLLIDHAADDVLIEQILGAATKYAEQFCNRGFVEQEWQALFPAWPTQPCGAPPRDVYLELSRGNLFDAALVEVEYVDSTGAVQTLDDSVYLIDDASVPGRIRLAPDQSWPELQSRWDAVRVTYTVGWDADDVPEPIKQAILLLIAQMYENRTPEVTGTIVSPIQFSFEALLSTYRIVSIQ